ncbi:hypothetical protein CKA32_004326 [Geitlerinema sp. FC II]|nr:hypothetical protein CKA32_004326 [Geitlerinema sp. FC II]
MAKKRYNRQIGGLEDQFIQIYSICLRSYLNIIFFLDIISQYPRSIAQTAY